MVETSESLQVSSTGLDWLIRDSDSGKTHKSMWLGGLSFSFEVGTMYFVLVEAIPTSQDPTSPPNFYILRNNKLVSCSYNFKFLRVN